MPSLETESTQLAAEIVKAILNGLVQPDIRLTVVAVVPWIVIGLVAIAAMWLKRPDK